MNPDELREKKEMFIELKNAFYYNKPDKEQKYLRIAKFADDAIWRIEELLGGD